MRPQAAGERLQREPRARRQLRLQSFGRFSAADQRGKVETREAKMRPEEPPPSFCLPKSSDDHANATDDCKFSPLVLNS
jgi:hypothetical protein